MAQIIKVNWKRHTRRLAKAIFLSMTAGTMLMSQAYAQSYDKPITLDYDTDYGTAQTTGTYKGVLTKDDSDEDNIKLTYDFGKDGIVDIETKAGTTDIAPIGHGKLDAGTTISATIQAKTLNLTASTSNSGELMNGSAGIYAMSGVDLTINSDVNIKVDNRTDSGVDFFVYGIDVPMAGSKKTGITINGNLSMVGNSNDNTSDDYWGVITHAIHANGGGAGADYQGSRWAPAGLYLQGKKGSHITVNGDVDLRVKGIGVLADCYSDKAETVYNNKINLNGGDVYIETPKDSTEGYYSVASFGGTVNINMNEEETASLNHKVTLIGNIFSMADDGNGYEGNTPTYFANGKLNIGLSTADSSWTGIIDNTGAKATGIDKNTANTDGSQIGVVNLFLSNGATWNYESLGAKNGQDVATMPSPSITHYGVYDGISHVTKLTGGKDADTAGIIKIKDSDPIEIGTAEGTTKIWYDHEDGTPGTIKGGDVKVLAAKAGTTMMLYTGNNGITKGLSASDAAVDKNNVSEVLNALAHKLWYLAGDTNLSGTVNIAEGLTASSATLKTGAISFSTDSTGTKQAGQGFYDYTPETDGNEQSKTEFAQGIFGVEKHDTEYVEGNILQKDGTYRFTKDTSISLDDDGYEIVDGSKNAYDSDIGRPIRSHSVIQALAESTNDTITIDATGKELNLKIAGGENDLDDDNTNVSLITASGTKDKTAEVKIVAKNLNLSMADDMLSQLGMGDTGLAILADNNGRITIDGNVNLDTIDGIGIALGRYGGSDGDSEYSQNEVTIGGNLNITNAGAGINISGGNSKVIVKGHTSIANMKDQVGGAAYEDIFGVGLFNVEDNDDVLSDESTISLGASDIEMAEGKSAVYGKKGTININTGVDGTQTGKTVIAGNIISDGGTINLALNDESSYLKGRVQTNGGKINLALSDGGYWDNQGTTSEKGKTTKLNTLSGDNGYIYQNNEDTIDVVNYSGKHTVFYAHDEKTPTSIIGGDFRITNAESGSTIQLITDRKGITAGFTDTDKVADRNMVSEVLNKLAQKLFYTANDGKLSGTVAIAEGLTASSATLKSGDISFSTASTGTKTAGQGFYDYTPVSEKVYKTGPITGSEDISTSRESDEAGIVTVKADTINAENKYTAALYAGNSTSYSSPMKVDLNGKSLALESVANSKLAMAIYAGNNSWININNSSKNQELSLTATNNNTTGAYGIYVNGSAHLTISGPVDIHDVTTQGDSAIGIHIQGQKSDVTIDGSLKISNVKGIREKGFGINAAGINVTGDNSTVTVTGPVDISGVRGSGIALKGADTKVSVGGGKITAVEDADKSHNFYAARVDQGQLDINMKDGAAGSITTQITGDMYVTGQYGKKVVEYTGGELIDWSNAGILNLALTDSSSFWKGIAAYDQYNSDYGTGGNTMHDIGQFNLYLQNGATWTNEQQSHGTKTTVADKNPVWEGSTLATLYGGSDADHAGVIYQNDSNPISVNTYSGYTTVFYDHDASDPTNIIGGDFKITNAAEGSSITLVTDSKGISSGWKEDDSSEAQRNVYQVLNKLAGKLYYNSYKDGHLAGFVKIADGLTASSTSLKMENISFYDDSDVTSGAASEAGWGYVKDSGSSEEGDFKNTPITGDTTESADPSQEVYKKAGILGSDGVYKFVNDTTLETTDYNAIIDAKENVTIDAAGKVLTFVGINDTQNKAYKVGVFSTNGKDITINAKKLVIDVEQSKDGGITYGINANGVDNGKWIPTNVTINGDVDITSISPAGGAYGVWARGKATVNLNGKVTMRNDGKDAEGNDIYAVDSKDTGNFFYGAAGLYVTSEWGENNYGATINADTVDFKINGNGIWANIGGGTVNVNGGTIELKKDSPTGYAALLAECGTVNMNVIKNDQGEVIDAGNHDVVIKGNVSALTGAIHPLDRSTYSTVNLGLTTDASSLHGVIWNGFRDKGEYNDEYDEDGEHLFYGRTNLWLKNGATWTNEAWGTVDIRGQNYYGKPFAGSLVSNFHGGSDEAHTGYIFQQETRPITLQNYSGYTTVFYQHDENDPTTMIGGDLTIQKAEAGSGITLITDNKGLTKGFSTDDKAADQNQVSEVLNKLAQKLFYTANDGNLVGTVKIAEGLTASSATLKKGNISFSTTETGTKTAGQGFYDYTPADDSVLTAKITGGNDKKYVNLGIETETGIYNFTDNATITVTKGSYSSELGAIESSSGPITINADGKTLDVSYTVPSGSYVARGVATGLSYGKKDISITAGKLNLASKTSGFYGQGVYATGGTISIDADTTISTSAQTETNGIYAGSNGIVTMNGNLTITEDTGASKYYALKADDNGTINVNVKDGKAANGVVKINSDIFTKSTESYDDWEEETTTTTSTINLALKGKDTSWTGRSLYEKQSSGDYSTSYGNFNLWLENGATWTNQKTGKDIPTGFAGSHVTSFSGNGGYIYQNDTHAITVDNYSGDTTVVYQHKIVDDTTREKADLYGNKAASIIGGDFTITNAAEGSSITLVTDRTGLNLDSDASYTDKNLISDTLDKLANKLFYTGYADEHLTGYVKIAEGLTASSITQVVKSGDISGDISYKDGGQGYYDYKMAYPESQIETNFTTAITGNATTDALYAEKGVLKDDGTYVFTAKSTTITPEKYLVPLGPWMPSVAAAISGADEKHNVTIDLKGNNLTVDSVSDTHTTGITAVGDGVVEINNAGDMSISAESTKTGQTGALCVNGGGTIKIHNDGVLTLRAKSKQPANAAVIKSMNGKSGVMSSITIDGLVDIVADKGEESGANEAISAVASKVEIGGGSIKAINGAAYAIRAYGEMASDNRATVNVNVKKDAEGNVIGAGNNKVQMEGDVFLSGSMDNGGARADVTIGLNTKDSYWNGNAGIANFENGSEQGIITLYMGNGATWTGNNISQNTVNATLDSGATWNGYNTGKVMNLALNDASIWNVTGDSQLTSFTGKDGFIHLDGEETGNVTVANYSGDTTIVYKHTIVDDTTRDKADFYGNKAASIIGGDFTITNAAEGSSITLVTDRTGLNLDSDVYTDKNLISDTLDKLANKLFYTSYADGHLTGYVKIAEGLTASSITQALKTGDISYKEDGQGYYAYNRVLKPAQSSYEEAPITGDNSDGADPSQEIYKDTGIMQADGTYTFTKDTTITSGSYAKVVDAKKDVTINADGQTLTMVAEGPKALASAVDGDTGNNITINAKKLILKADAKTKGYGIKTSGNGKVTINGDVDASVIGKYGAYGVHATGSEVDINGTFTIRNDDGWAVASDGGFSFYGAAGLYATSAWGNNNKGGTINVDKVDMKLDGNGAWTNIGGGVITIGGGNIEINRENTKGYAALRAECGTINMNVVKDKDGNIIGAGDQKVTIKGNVDVNTGAINDVDKSTYTTINLGLTTSDSYLHGVYRNGFKDEGNIHTNGTKKFYGVTNLWLQNGAQWIHEEYGPIGENYYGELYKGSQLTNLYGGKDAEHAGIIFQENADPIAVKNYSGNTIVVYKHDIVEDTDREKAELYGNKAASIIGGDFTITNAAEGSSITLVTDRTGLNLDSDVYTDKNLISDTLDKLANKLFYTGYADGHLTGYVKIAEGLTASSITQVVKSGDISYKDGGQGYYDYDLVYPNEQVKDPMNTVIDGSDASKDAYRDAGIYKDEDDIYHFTKDPATVGSDDKSTGLIEAKDNDVNVVAKDTLKLVGKDGGVGILAENGKTSNTTGNTDITVKDGTGVLADGGHVKLTGDTTINAGTGMEAKAGGTITTTGKTDITVAEGKDAVKASGKDTTIDLKTGTLTGNVSASDAGKISTDGATIKGNVSTENNGAVTIKAGIVNGDLISNGGTITSNGTQLTGNIKANAGTVEMTSGTVSGDVQAAGGKTNVTDTAISGILQATKGGEITMTNGSATGITADAESKVNASLTGKDASLAGTIANEGDVTISLAEGASWTGDATGKGKTKATVGKGSTWTGKSSDANMALTLAGTWQNTGDSKLASLKGQDGTLDMTGESGDISIGSYSGSMKAIYKHNEEKPTEIYGGNVTVNAAEDGATIDLVTDSKGLKLNGHRKVEKDTVSETLNQLAQHLIYKGEAGKLTGKVGIAEGLTSSSASLRAEKITFDADGVGHYIYDPASNDLDIEYGSEETRMMQGTKSSLLGTTMMWRSNNNDVLRRMGDLRLNQGETGAWARYMGGKNKFDQQHTYLSQSYNVAQVGYDKKVSDWTIGLALDHANGKNSFNGGKAKEKMTTLAIYGTKVSDDGSYIDIIVKTGKVTNKFDVSNEVGNKLHSDYDTWGTSLSMEYGKRFVRDNGFYLDPSVELTMGRLNSKDYVGTSDLGLLNVKQHAFDSAIGRIALALGKETPRSNVFAKFALAHEFGGAFKTDFFAEDGGLKSTRIDLKDTWLDVELGGTYKLNGNASIYGTFTRNFAADMTTKWRVDAGVRFTF